MRGGRVKVIRVCSIKVKTVATIVKISPIDRNLVTSNKRLLKPPTRRNELNASDNPLPKWDTDRRNEKIRNGHKNQLEAQSKEIGEHRSDERSLTGWPIWSFSICGQKPQPATYAINDGPDNPIS